MTESDNEEASLSYSLLTPYHKMTETDPKFPSLLEHDWSHRKGCLEGHDSEPMTGLEGLRNGWSENKEDVSVYPGVLDSESLLQVRNLVKSFRESLQAEAEQAMSGTDGSIDSNSTSTRSSPAADSAEVRELREELRKTASRESILKDELSALKRLYEKEVSMRRALSDELMAIKGNIRVFVRVRPQLRDKANDLDKKLGKIVDQVDDRSIAYLPQGKRYEFDACINDRTDHLSIFERHIAPFVVHVMDGTNCTLIAYGQTGSGKTHTMQGTIEDPGMNQRAFDRAFEIARSNPKEKFTFTVSVLQVYNETLQDLLAPATKDVKQLEIGQHSDSKAICVKGLHKVKVSDSAEVSSLLDAAMKRRSVGSHAMNEASSRSHLVLTLEVNGKSSLVLIDLAGSERASKTEATGERLRESQYINKSLSALGDVLQSLGEKQAKHHPFRNSKLTFLLQDVLSGNSKVAFFACVSPEVDSHSETFCTLNFAERIRRVELSTLTATAAIASHSSLSVKSPGIGKTPQYRS